MLSFWKTIGTHKYNTLLSRKFHAYKRKWPVEESIPNKARNVSLKLQCSTSTPQKNSTEQQHRIHETLWNTDKCFLRAFWSREIYWNIQGESWQQRVKLAPRCVNTQEFTFFVYFYQPMYTHTHTRITLLSHGTGFPGNWTSFLILYAAHLIRRLILPWLWPWCWRHRIRQEQKVWTNVSELRRVSPSEVWTARSPGPRLAKHSDLSTFPFHSSPVDTFTLSLGGDKPLCFPVTLKHLSTAHKQENIRACSKQKGLRRVSTSRNTNTKARRFCIKY